MHFATRFRFVFFGLLPLLAGFIVSSCQSSRPSFSFQPATYRSLPVAAASPGQPSVDSVASPAAPTNAAGATPAPATRRLPRRAVRLAAAWLPHLPTAALADPTVTASVARPATQPHYLPRLLQKRATHGAAENGLGGIALFFIGVALALVAGLGALFALIPGVSFWGGVGLAVAALVVLFLLYSLVSGGKKKKAPGTTAK